MENKKVKIKDVVKLFNGYPFKPGDWGDKGLNIIRIQNLNDPLASFNKTTVTVPEKFLVKNGDILISWSASLGIYEWKGEDAVLNQHIFRVEFIADKILKKYFKFVIELALKELSHKMHGVGILHLTKGQLEEYEFDLPDIEKQNSIIGKLSSVEDLIIKRKKSIQILEEYNKSTFLELFGDPILNQKKWKTKKIMNLARKERDSIKRGPFGSTLKKQDFVSEGFLVYEQYHALNDDFNFERYFIDQNKYNNLIDFKVEAGDIIISCSGVNLGRLAVIPEIHKKGIINQALLKLSLDQDIILNDFFVQLFKNENFRKKYLGLRGVGIPNFPPMTDFRNFDFILPPMKLQRRFSEINKVVKIQMQQRVKSLKVLEELFQSLLYNSFKLEQVETEDELDLFINDELKVETLIQDLNTSQDFETLTQYDLAKQTLFQILERSEYVELENSKSMRGILQLFKNSSVQLITTKQYKLEIENEADPI